MYFMTSMENAWGSECAPSTDEDQDCVLRYTNVLDPGAIFTRDAFKWLSPEDECVWAGVECDGFGQIVKIDLSTCFVLAQKVLLARCHLCILTHLSICI
jgi:hypothetical protein